MIALGNLLSELEVNGPLYSLNSVDVMLIGIASEVLETVSKPFMELVERPVMAESEYSSWEEYLKAYKVAAAEENAAFETAEDGKSLLDFVDLEPVKRAFRDGIDPKRIARIFAKDFDPMAFGR